MADFEEARNAMVDQQIRARGVDDHRVLEAFRKVPRHAFVPPEHAHSAYIDHPLSVGLGQTISQPYIVALMTALLELRPGDKVLEVGTGSGYQAAILAELAGRVVSVERHPELAGRALQTLRGLGYGNVDVHTGDGTLGWPEEAPYNAVIVTAAAPSVPEPLKAQLAVGGRLVCPVGVRRMQQLVKIVRTDDAGFKEDHSINCVFVPLLGEAGWPE